MYTPKYTCTQAIEEEIRDIQEGTLVFDAIVMLGVTATALNQCPITPI